MNFSIDFNRSLLVFSRVDNAFKNGYGLLSETNDLVENQIPEGVSYLSRDHALFLFYTVVNDHGMKSSRLYKNAKTLFYERPELFDPENIVNSYKNSEDINLINDTGKKLGTRYPKITAKNWYLNSMKLLDEYSGNPVKLYNSSKNAKILLKNILSYSGFGSKIGGMLLRAIFGLGFNKNIEGFGEVFQPVDIHDSRISFLTGIIKTKIEDSEIDYYKYVNDIQKVLLETSNTLGINWLDADRALWLIGSRGCTNKRCLECPLNDLCSTGVNFVEQQSFVFQ